MMINTIIRLTGGGCFTDECDQVVLDLGKSVIVVHNKHVSLAGFAADDSQLCHVYIGHSHYKDAVACRNEQKSLLNEADQLKRTQSKADY